MTFSPGCNLSSQYLGVFVRFRKDTGIDPRAFQRSLHRKRKGLRNIGGIEGPILDHPHEPGIRSKGIDYLFSSADDEIKVRQPEQRRGPICLYRIEKGFNPGYDSRICRMVVYLQH